MESRPRIALKKLARGRQWRSVGSSQGGVGMQKKYLSDSTTRFRVTASPKDAAKSDSDFLKATNYSGFRVEGGWKPIIMVRGDGMQLEDEQGRKYLDFSSQPS